MLASHTGLKPFVFREFFCIYDASFLFTCLTHRPMVFSFKLQFLHCWKEDYANIPFGVICRQPKLFFLVLLLTTAASSINSFSFFYFVLGFSFSVHRTSAQSSILKFLCWAARLGTLHMKHIVPRIFAGAKVLLMATTVFCAIPRLSSFGGDFCLGYAFL